MKDKKYLYPGLVAIFCALMVSLGLVSLIYGSPETTVIGKDISTRNLTVSGNASTTGTLYAKGDIVLGSDSADTLTVNATTTFATTTIFKGTTTLGEGGRAITKLLFGSITLNFAEVATNTSALATTSLPDGASADMKCFLQPPDLPDDFLPKGCTTTASYIGATLYNDGQEAAGTDPDGSGANWGYLLIK